MKRVILGIFVLLFLLGCGENKSESKLKGVVADKDYVSIGMKYLSEKDVPNAIKNFDMAIKSDPLKVENYVTLGQVYLGLKNYDRAIDTLSAATRVDVNNPDAFYFLAMSSSLRQRDKDMDVAIKAIKRSVELYMANKNQEGFVKAMALYKSLSGEEAPTTPTN